LSPSQKSRTQVSLFVNKGDGSFAAPVEYVSTKRPTRVVVGDVNADGIPDLVIGAYPHVNVRLGVCAP